MVAVLPLVDMAGACVCPGAGACVCATTPPGAGAAGAWTPGAGATGTMVDGAEEEEEDSLQVLNGNLLLIMYLIKNMLFVMQMKEIQEHSWIDQY